MNIKYLVAGLAACSIVAAHAATPLTESTFTEIIGQATVVAASTKEATPARKNEVFRVPDLVRTGPDSRVEMTAPDKTITRIGANTVFTFEPGKRIILLEKGSVLFHSPDGAGGGAIHNRGTAAAVLGTTMIGVILEDGSFKIMVLEGEVKVTLRNGLSITLKAGEMVIVPPDEGDFSEVMIFNIGKLVNRLQLVMGVSQPLSSMQQINAAIQKQGEQIAAGTAGTFVPFLKAAAGLDIIPNIVDSDLKTEDHTIIFVSPVRP